ncbi:MAG: hypothetical protein JO166_17300 [Deltaproteobacteria bacterium]|nr:hypothetical protein [Deltaproteobacteria bacterium]
MAEHTAAPVPPYIDDPNIKDAFADSCAGINFANGNFHLTFVSFTADHSRDPPPTRRTVSARVVIPAPGALELRDMLTQFIHMLTAQRVLPLAPHELIIPTPTSGRSVKSHASDDI